MEKIDAGLRRYAKLQKMASGAATLLQTAYIGNKIEKGIEGRDQLLRDAYDIHENYGSIDKAIDSAENKRDAGRLIAALAAVMAPKIGILKAIPIAVAAVMGSRHYEGKADGYKAVKGKQLVLQGLKGM